METLGRIPSPVSRTAGVPYTMDQEDKRLRDFHSVLELLSAPPINDSLCCFCDEIDFRAIFDFLQPQREYTLSMNRALESVDCSFCKVIAAAARTRPEIISACRQRVVECIVRSVVSRPTGASENELVPWLVLSIFLKVVDPQMTGPGIHMDLNHLTDFDFLVKDPLLVLEPVGRLEHAVCSPASTPAMSASVSGSPCSSSSEDSEFEAQYVKALRASWKSRRIRLPIPAQLDFSRLRTRLERSDVKTKDQQVLLDANGHELKPALLLKRLTDSARLRAVDVLTGDVVALDETQRYLTLSYAWGGYTLDKSAISRDHRQSGASARTSGHTAKPAWTVDWRLMPKTICDAADFVRCLRERYLWVDCLSIDQSDPEDMRAILPEMNAIYSCSYLNIVAAAGSNADFGLPGVNEGSRQAEQPLTLISKGVKFSLLPQRAISSDVIRQSFWYTRAWTYQEHQLPPKSICFTETEASLHLHGNVGDERYSTVALNEGERRLAEKTARPSGLLRAFQTAETLSWANYGNAVLAYTRRNITDPGDRLAAFLGLFDRFLLKDLPSEHRGVLSGLPLQWFYESLMWKPDCGSLKARRHNRCRYDKSQGRALPSWSWVGWTGDINMHENNQRDRHKSIKVRVLDQSNISCESYSFGAMEPWPQQPRLCDITENNGVILHLWATRIRLAIARHKRFTPYMRCDLWCLSVPNFANYRFGSIQLDEESAIKYCDGTEHEFLVLDTKALLVEKHGPFYEPVALGTLDDSRVIEGKLVHGQSKAKEYVDEVGVRGQYMLR